MSTDKQRAPKGRHPNSMKNLKPFKKGEPSPNPKGRPPKDCSITSIIKAEIDKKVTGDDQGRTWRQMMADSLRNGALKNPALMKELLDRLEGKVPPAVTEEEGEPVKASIIFNVANEQEAQNIRDLGTKWL